MELTETSGRMRDCSIDFLPVYIKEESIDCDTDFNDDIITAAQQFCAIEIKENKSYGKITKSIGPTDQETKKNLTDTSSLNSALNSTSETGNCNLNSVLNTPVYLHSLNCESVNVEIPKANEIAEVFMSQNEPIQLTNYNVSTVSIPNEFLRLNENIKKEVNTNSNTIYTAEWLCNSSGESGLQLKFTKNTKQLDESPLKNQDINEVSVIPIINQGGQSIQNSDNVEDKNSQSLEKARKHMRVRSLVFQDYKEKLRRKAECMREKRKKLYEQETEEQRQHRLAKEAAKRREMRMYYETPEQRRKRLDAEAARKREYRMYNETAEDRRKRLDREAERRRIKRLSLYATETAEQRRERLNKESAKRREARINQYAKETEEERKERLKKDALRVREMRFTRSAIETEEERRQRLVKDALRKREVRMHGSQSTTSDFTELQTVRNFEEFSTEQMKDNADNHLGGHYLTNWMMWFQNTLAQPVHTGEQIAKTQANNSK